MENIARPAFAMSEPLASTFLRTGLANIQQEFPNKLDHVMNNASEVRSPRSLHPVFYGSYDWHSCVHMHWLLAHLLRRHADSEQSIQITDVFDRHFSASNVALEIAYLNQPSRESFERTYGWAWLLKLQAELIALGERTPAALRWSEILQPLADAFVERYSRFIPLAQFPIRAGTHANSAFGLYFALDYAECAGNDALRERVCSKARDWYLCDRRYPAEYEPNSDDFLSGGLMEAALMLRVLGDAQFVEWWADYCPQEDRLRNWLHPVSVSDRRDPKLAHLDGLNLSRAWCWQRLVESLPEPQKRLVVPAIQTHLDAALPHACSGDYASTHWLASFALLALGEN